MPEPDSIDGVLVQWGDRLFYPGNRIVKGNAVLAVEMRAAELTCGRFRRRPSRAPRCSTGSSATGRRRPRAMHRRAACFSAAPQPSIVLVLELLQLRLHRAGDDHLRKACASSCEPRSACRRTAGSAGSPACARRLASDVPVQCNSTMPRKPRSACWATPFRRVSRRRDVCVRAGAMPTNRTVRRRPIDLS